MNRQWSYIKTQIPTNEEVDYTQTITKGFEFVPKENGKDTVVTKLSITAETNLKLAIGQSNETMVIFLKQGTTWSIDNEDMYNLQSIRCENDTAKVTFMVGYRIK